MSLITLILVIVNLIMLAFLVVISMIFHCNNCDNYSIVYRPSLRELLKCIQDNGRTFFPTNERVTFLTDEHSLGDEATKLMLGNLFKSALISLERTIPMVTGEYLFVSPRNLFDS